MGFFSDVLLSLSLLISHGSAKCILGTKRENNDLSRREE